MTGIWRAAPAVLIILLISACASAGSRLAAPAAPMTATSLRARCVKAAPATRMDCFNNGLLAELHAHGIRPAMQMLDSLGAVDTDVRRDGHMYAHSLGLNAYSSRDSVGRTFRECTPSFQSGCYHGVIQSYFSDIASAHEGISTAVINDLCKDYRANADGDWLLFQCVHGMGHGLSQIAAHDLKHTLAFCDELASPWEEQSCYGGAFMENAMEAFAPHHAMGRPAAMNADMNMSDHDMASMPGMDHSGPPAPKLVDPADPLYPCSALADRYLSQCYLFQTSIMLRFNKGDFRDATATCDRVDVKYRRTCYQSIGRDASSYALQDFARGAAYCSNGDPQYQPACHHGFVMNLMDITADYKPGVSYCATLTASSARKECYQAVGEELRVLYGDDAKRIAACGEVEVAYRDVCIATAVPPVAREY